MPKKTNTPDLSSYKQGTIINGRDWYLHKAGMTIFVKESGFSHLWLGYDESTLMWRQVF